MIGVWTPPAGAVELLAVEVGGEHVPAGSKNAFAARYKDERGKWRVKIVYDKNGNEQAVVSVTDSNNRRLEKRAKVIQTAVLEAGAATDFKMPGPDVPLAIVCTFYVPRGKGHYGTGANADKLKDSAPAYPATKPDTTKLWRGFEDALTGVLWHDDSRVVAQPIFEEFVERWEPPLTRFAFFTLPATVAERRISGADASHPSLLASP